MDEQMREKFEAWAKDREYDTKKFAGEYEDFDARQAWFVWQACAAALSQPAAQGDSSHPAGGECGGVQVPVLSPDFDDICKTCGKDYGSHFNVICPVGRGQWEATP